MDRFLHIFEKSIIFSLIVMMVFVVTLSTVELGWILAKDVLSPPLFMLEIQELLDVFGFFLLILIGVELLETIKAYLKEHVVHVEIVVEVALIAIARKVIILDIKDLTSGTLLGVAALVLTVALAHYLQKRSHRESASVTAPGREAKN